MALMWAWSSAEPGPPRPSSLYLSNDIVSVMKSERSSLIAFSTACLSLSNAPLLTCSSSMLLCAFLQTRSPDPRKPKPENPNREQRLVGIRDWWYAQKFSRVGIHGIWGGTSSS